MTAAAVAVAGPVEPATAAGAGLEVVPASGDYTLEAEPSVNASGTEVNLTNTGTTRITSYSITVDYRSLAGTVDVSAPLSVFDTCREKSEGLLVCDGAIAPAPGESLGAELRVRSLKGARAGTTGEIRIGGEADGAEIPSACGRSSSPTEGSSSTA
ncbi:hypothetical protein DN402_08330 [Streptomyces sp. SW4]|nr:hypothetical protein DN402_08330 [Streptomyces sp. SW4]